MHLKKYVLTIVVLIITLCSLGAMDLQGIIDNAKAQSSTIQLIQLSKKQSDLSIELKEIEEETGIEVSANMSIQEMNWGTLGAPDTRYTLVASPKAVISFTNDGKTTVSVELKSIRATLQGNLLWEANPAVTLSHTHSFNPTTNNISDLTLAKQRMDLDYSYQQRLYDFENSIYTKIIEIIGYEKSLMNAQRDILIQQRAIERALTLRTTTRESIVFQNMTLALARAEQSKIATTQRLEMAKIQFAQMTGTPWEGVSSIRDANLAFIPLDIGDSSVISATLAYEIAREELQLATREDKGRILFSGGADLLKTANNSISYGVSAGATLIKDTFSLGATLKLDIGTTVSPTIIASGTWRNDTAKESELLRVQTLQNSMTIAGIDVQEAMLSYQIKAHQLEADILSHTLEVAQFEQNLAYNKQVLEQARISLEKGLVTQTDVDDAQFAVEITSYDKTIYALRALLLENRAKALLL